MRGAILLVVISLLLVLVPASASAQGSCTILGTNGADKLRGRDGADVICGLGGNDTIYGLGGGDRIVGGPGDDHLYGGAGPDLLIGGPGKDVLRGGSGRDTLSGGPGANSCPSPEMADTIDRCRPVYARSPATTRPCWFDYPQTCGSTDTPDQSPPRLSWLGVDPQVADNTAGPTVVNVYVGALDASPVVSVKAHMHGPQGFSRELSLTPGAQGGFESHGTATLPAGSPTGIYAIDHLTLVDSQGNTAEVSEAEIEAGQYPRDLEVYAGPDSEGPALEAFSISPINVDTSTGAATVTLRAKATDALSGVDEVGPSFDIPSQEPSKVFFPAGTATAWGGSAARVHDGEWVAEIQLPHHAAQGNYELNAIQLHDRAGNFTTYDREEIEGMGFPVTFTETGPGDTTPPEVTDFWMEPTTLRASHGERTIFFYVHVVDDLSGFGLWPRRPLLERPGRFRSAGRMAPNSNRPRPAPSSRSREPRCTASGAPETVVQRQRRRQANTRSRYVAATDLAGAGRQLDTRSSAQRACRLFVNLPAAPSRG